MAKWVKQKLPDSTKTTTIKNMNEIPYAILVVICRERRQRQENPKVLLTRGPGIWRGEHQRDLDSSKK